MMELSWDKKKSDIIRYVIIGILFITGFALSWGGGPEIKIFYLFLAFVGCTSIKLKSSTIADIILPLYAYIVGSYVDHVTTLYKNSFLDMFGTKSVTMYSVFVHGMSGYVVEFLVIIGLYFLLRALVVPSKIAAIIAPLPTILLSLADYFVIRFRGSELSPSDILGARTAFNVAGNYKFPFAEPLLLVYIPLILYIGSIILIKTSPKKNLNRLKSSGIFIGIAVLTSVLLIVSVNSISKSRKTEYLSNNPSRLNGYITNFALQIKDLRIKKPEGYNKSDFDNIYATPEVSIEPDVNIIVIMNESLADMTIYNDVIGNVDDSVPYYKSATNNANTRAGYAYSSVYGGNTCNSEFEFLTGLSTAGLPTGAIPYSMYLTRPLYSLPRYLDEIGYTSTALHPYFSSGWNRTTAYPNLDFDNMLFMNDFTYEPSDIIRGATNISEDSGFMSDECAYRNVIDMAESSTTPGFYFLVTIQNHGGYSPDQEKLPVTDYAKGTTNDPELNTYLTNARRSDDAIKMLFEELSKSDKKYVVLVFGDHQPALEAVQDKCGESAPNDLKWIVPYVLWSNFDMPETVLAGNPDTSINYLCLDVLSAAGIPYSPYFESINSVRASIPVINAYGYYSNATNSWHTLEDNEGELNKYFALQYYSLFDAKLQRSN